MKAASCEASAQQSGGRTAVVLFLHGSGDSGSGFQQWLSCYATPEQMAPYNAKVLFPTATQKPYTPMMGQLSNVWFDRPKLHYDAIEDAETLAESVTLLDNIVEDAMSAAGEDPHLCLVGFSMGGSMAMHLAFHRLRHGRSTHAVIVHSSFVGRFSHVIPDVTQLSADELINNVAVPQIAMIHGLEDTKVPSEWGKATSCRLGARGFAVEYKEISGLRHELSRESTQLLLKFLSVALHATV